jgi:hypothetical protein
MGEIYRMRTMNGSGRLMGGMMKEENHVREKNRDITLRQIRKKKRVAKQLLREENEGAPCQGFVRLVHSQSMEPLRYLDKYNTRSYIPKRAAIKKWY